MANYNWTRYWHKLGDNPRSNGFLYTLNEYESTFFPFDKFSHIPCLALLGEPGMGKSNEIKRIAGNENKDENSKLYVNLNSVGTEVTLFRKVFDSEKIKKWRNNQSKFYLYLDSLDEALLNITTLSGLLADEISELPTNRLFLRVACRSAEWSSFYNLNNKLSEVWKGQDFQVIQLAPLTQQDVIEAAKCKDLDGNKFLKEVFEKDVVPLAAKPVTLNLLLNLFRDKSELPSNQSELYKRGCLTLCDEDYADKPNSKEKDELTVEQRLRVAARIAALMIFSKKSSIWRGRDTGEQTDVDILENDLNGFFEINDDGSKFEVNKNNVRETLRKGLFKGETNNRVKFSHQTFAEFLAAWYLSYRVVPDEIVIRIIGKEYIYPQLNETSSRIASQRKTISRHLMQVAPLVLLRSDILSAEQNFRTELTKNLLEIFDKEQSFETEEYHYFQKLNHPKISEQLRPYIKDKNKGWVVRKAAISIARSCKTTELQDDLVEVALDIEDDHYIRLLSTFALADIGDSQTLCKLEPLIYEGETTDKNLELKFSVLDILWRENITAEKIFEVLDDPPRGYSYFISHTLGEKLKLEDLSIALDWINRQIKNKGHLSYDMERLAEQIMLKAWEHLDQKEILSKFTQVSIAYSKTHQDIFRKDISKEEREKLNQDTEKRKKILLEILSFVKKEEDFWKLFHSDILSFRGEDISWMIEEWNKSKNLSTDLKIADIIKGWLASSHSFYSKGLDPSFLDKIWLNCEINPEFNKIFYEFFEEIIISSGKAECLKESYKKMLEQRNKWKVEEKEDAILKPTPKERVLEFLDKFENGEIDGWWQLNYFMMFLPNGQGTRNESEPDLTQFPVWNELDNETQNRVIQAAKTYLTEGNPQNEKWIKKNGPHRPAVAGYRAIKLLKQFEPTYIEELNKDIWTKWVSTIYFIWVYSQDDNLQEQKEIIANVYKIVPEQILECLLNDIERENRKENPHLRLYKLELCSDEKLTNVLKEGLIKYNLQFYLFDEILGKLFELNDEDAEKIACDLIKYPIPKSKKAQQKMLAALRLLLQYGKSKCWEKIWKVLTKDDEKGRSLIESIVFGVSRNRKGTLNLSEKQASDLFLWLSKNYPHNEDPVHNGIYSPSVRDEIVSWRDSFLYYLVEKGTAESVEQINKIKNELPHLERVKQLELNAIEKMREKNWQPFSSQKLLKMFIGVEEDKNMNEKQKEYDVALSFAGEQRVFVQPIAKLLKDKKVKVFYDDFEKARLAGKDLYIELADIYSNRSKFVIVFVSKEYKDKIWTNHEIRNAFERAIEQDGYIIPARFDDTEITGLRKTIGYIDLRKISPFEFVEMITEKLSENL